MDASRTGDLKNGLVSLGKVVSSFLAAHSVTPHARSAMLEFASHDDDYWVIVYP